MRNKSDEELAQFLSTSSNDLLLSLAEILSSWFVHKGFRGRFSSADEIPSGADGRLKLAYEIVDELSYFGSHNLAYLGRKLTGKHPGVGYHETLYEACHILQKQANKNKDVPRIASVMDREEMICSQLLQIAFKGKSEEDIARMLSEAGLESDMIQARAIRSAVQSGGAGAFMATLKIVGKKTVMKIVQAALYKLLAARLGKEAAERIIEILAKKISQKALQAFLGAIGAAFIVHDIFKLAGPASRVCVPAVALIAAARVNSRISSVEA